MVLRHHGRFGWAAALGVFSIISVSAPAQAARGSSRNTPSSSGSEEPVFAGNGEVEAPRPAAPSVKPPAPEVMPGPGRIESVEIQFRRLGDQLAEGVRNRAGGGRYDRWAVLPFTELGPEVERNQLGELSTTRLESVLTTDHQFINVNRKQLMEVVQEKGLMHVLVFEEGKIRQVGRACNADVLVSGSVGLQSGRYVINARAANVETGQVVAVARAEIDMKAFNKAAADNVMRTRYLAALRSAVLPGWGQIANHDRIKAGVVIVGTATLLTLALRDVILGYGVEQKYLGITNNNPGPCTSALEGTGGTAAFNSCLHQHVAPAVSYYQTANKYFAGLGALYLLQIADAFIFARNPNAVRLTTPGSPGDVSDPGVHVGLGLQGLTLSGSF